MSEVELFSLPKEILIKMLLESQVATKVPNSTLSRKEFFIRLDDGTLKSYTAIVCDNCGVIGRDASCQAECEVCHQVVCVDDPSMGNFTCDQRNMRWIHHRCLKTSEYRMCQRCILDHLTTFKCHHGVPNCRLRLGGVCDCTDNA